MPRSSLLLALAAAAGLVACGGGGDSSGGPDTLQVALLTSGPVSDAGWYAGAYEGLLAIRDSLGARVSHQQTRTPAEFDEAFVELGSAGYDVVFAHGFEYQDAALRAAGRFPEMTIVVSGGGRVGPGVVPLIFQLEEGSYLAGMVAGGMTRTGTVGMVGGVAIPPAVGTFRAFVAGARAVNPSVNVLETFTGNWDDVAAAKEAAVAQLGRGADVLIHNVDAGSFGVFQAVREASSPEAPRYAMGMNRDQNDVAPDVILGSAVIRIPEAFLTAVRRYLSGDLPPQPFYVGEAQEVIDFVPNPALADRIPADLLARVDAARDSIRGGLLQVPRVPFVEGEEGVEVPDATP